jgi:hypothetical protein
MMLAYKIELARQAGHSDADILRHIGMVRPNLAGPIRAAAMAGYSPTDILGFLGATGLRSEAKVVGASVQDTVAADALRRLDPASRDAVDTFVRTLSASVDVVVPRGAPDPRMPGGMPWRQWERRRMVRIFRPGRVTMAEVRARAEKEKAERAAWLAHLRKLQRCWAKWMRWRRESQASADAYRQQHQDAGGGDQGWLVQFASLRLPRADARGQESPNAKKKGVAL